MPSSAVSQWAFGACRGMNGLRSVLGRSLCDGNNGSFLRVNYLQLDKDHGLYHKIKSHRLKTRGERVVRVLTDNANPGVVKGGADAGKAPFSLQTAVGILLILY